MNKSKYNIILYICCIAIVFIFFLYNVYTPMITDDYSYSLGINSVSDIIKSQYEHYFNWGGRSVAHFLAQLWLLIGKPLFNAANTIIYFLFIMLVCFHITGSIKKFNPLLFIIINMSFWILTPVWGEIFVWLTGSCNYLWTTTIILLFLAPFRKHLGDNEWKLNIPLSILYLFIGALAGWSNENSGAALLFFFIGYFIIKKLKDDKVRLFEILCLIGFLTGFILLICAPGNFARMESINEQNPRSFSLFTALIIRFFNITNMFSEYGIIFIIAIILTALDINSKKNPLLQFSIFGFNIKYQNQNKLKPFTYIYLLAAFIGAYSMVLSPEFPPRAYFIIIVFSVISFFQILAQRKYVLPEINKVFKIALITIFVFISVNSLIEATKGIIGVYIRWYDRIEYIYSEKSKNNFNLKVPAIHSKNKYNAFNGQSDLNVEIHDHPNTVIAAYFGLESISEVLIRYEGYGLRENIRKIIFPAWIFKYPQKENI